MSNEMSYMGEGQIKIVVDIVSAYVARNHIASTDLPVLMESVHAAISALASGGSVGVGTSEPETRKPTPSQIRKSVTPDALISFVDGKPYRTLKRHLTKHGLDPDTYRAQYGLPPDYPMVASSYSERRSTLAKNIGLGSRTGRHAVAEAPKPKAKERQKRA